MRVDPPLKKGGFANEVFGWYFEKGDFEGEFDGINCKKT